MSHHFPLERAFLRDGPTVLGFVAVGILLRLAFGRTSDLGFAADQIHRMRQRGH